MTAKNNASSEKLLWPNALRAISIFLVVVIHACSLVLVPEKEISFINQAVAVFFDSIARISVPIFLMISGAFLLNKPDNITTFFKKRASRILLPWFFWGTIQLFFNHYFQYEVFGDSDFKLILIRNFLSGFWFMPMIASIYLITPFLKPFFQAAKKTEYFIFFSCWFFLASLIPTIFNLLDFIQFYQLPIWLNYLGYFVGGYFITKKITATQKTLLVSEWFLLSNFLIVSFGTLYLLSQNNFGYKLFEYLSIPVVLMSFASFIILKNYFETSNISNKAQKVIHFLSDNSFGIFLSHMMILRTVERFLEYSGVSITKFSSVVTIPIISVFGFTTSLFIVSNLRKISYIKKLAG